MHGYSFCQSDDFRKHERHLLVFLAQNVYKEDKNANDENSNIDKEKF